MPYDRDAQSVALEPVRLFGLFFSALCQVYIFLTREIFEKVASQTHT